MIQNVAILDEQGKVLNVIVADPDDTELMAKLVQATKIGAHTYQAVTEDTGNPSREHRLIDGVFVDQLADAKTEASQAQARLAVIEPLLTKTQLAKADLDVAALIEPI